MSFFTLSQKAINELIFPTCLSGFGPYSKPLRPDPKAQNAAIARLQALIPSSPPASEYSLGLSDPEPESEPLSVAQSKKSFNQTPSCFDEVGSASQSHSYLTSPVSLAPASPTTQQPAHQPALSPDVATPSGKATLYENLLEPLSVAQSKKSFNQTPSCFDKVDSTSESHSYPTSPVSLAPAAPATQQLILEPALSPDVAIPSAQAPLHEDLQNGPESSQTADSKTTPAHLQALVQNDILSLISSAEDKVAVKYYLDEPDTVLTQLLEKAITCKVISLANNHTDCESLINQAHHIDDVPDSFDSLSDVNIAKLQKAVAIEESTQLFYQHIISYVTPLIPRYKAMLEQQNEYKNWMKGAPAREQAAKLKSTLKAIVDETQRAQHPSSASLERAFNEKLVRERLSLIFDDVEIEVILAECNGAFPKEWLRGTQTDFLADMNKDTINHYIEKTFNIQLKDVHTMINRGRYSQEEIEAFHKERIAALLKTNKNKRASLRRKTYGCIQLLKSQVVLRKKMAALCNQIFRDAAKNNELPPEIRIRYTNPLIFTQ